MRRVVVTGIAVVSPLGCEISEFWDRLCTGKSGIVPLTRFDVDEFKAADVAFDAGFNAAACPLDF